ncbi:hypothetical protein DPMN_148980 [Dreissena polymorpha]|uniref:Uncharacterized protein n=1 Tax=Dreissena polymorpha TaxID=45954 RepID=A0A9D4FAX1_DREPO|nr:hypothetical protein DPMN_148980 [Dreissena polymorpha]
MRAILTALPFKNPHQRHVMTRSDVIDVEGISIVVIQAYRGCPPIVLEKQDKVTHRIVP